MKQNRDKILCLYDQLMYDKGGKNVQGGTDIFFNEWCWKSWMDTGKRMEADNFLIPYVRLNLKWIKHLNVKPETIKP